MKPVTGRMRQLPLFAVTVAQRFLRQTRRYGIWSQLLIVVGVTVAIHWSLLLEAGGYLTWGNFLLPYTNSQYVVYASLPGGWNPYQYMGNPSITSFPQTVSFLTAMGPLSFISSFLGPSTAAKAYAVASTVILGAASLLFLRSLVRNFWGQLAGAMLLIAGPFQLQLLGQGDYQQFISEALILLAIFALWRAVRSPRTRWFWFPSSMAALVFALGSLQVFTLGVLLYGAFFLLCVLSSVRGSLRTRLQSLGRLSLRFLALPLLLAPLILPLLASPVEIGPSSAYALSFSTFASYSANPAAVFLMMGYIGNSLPPNFLGYQMVSLAAGPYVASIWMTFVVGLVLAVWSGLLIFKDRRGYFLLAVAVAGSLLGSGPYGPLGALNTYMYLHLVGYQAINASYYWDWVIVVPIFAAGLGVLVERIVERSSPGQIEQLGSCPTADPTDATPPPYDLKRTSSRGSRTPIIYLAGVIIAMVVIVSSALPYVVNAQSGPLGIHAIAYPSDYSRIDGLLERLIGPSYAGVALFNPDTNWYLNNGSQLVQNAFFLFPTVRTPGLPFYGAPPFSSNFYNYWAYKEFYTNATQYAGELFALEGIEYFLVFYGSQSASFYPYFLQFSYGMNASQLMEFQRGVIPVVTSKNFAIYRNLYYSNVAAPISNLSVVAGGYSELNAMAYAGVNLTNQALIFPSDVPSGECGGYMNRVDRIYAGTTNALYGLALPCTAVSSSDPVSDIPTGTQSWQTSYRDLGGSVWDAWPTPLATVQGGPYSIDVPINAQACSLSCSLWLPVRFSGDGGLLNFQWQGFSWTVNTSRGWQGSNNSMAWVQLPFGSVLGTGTLHITSISGWNAIGTVYTASSPKLTSWLLNTTESKQVFLLTPGEALQTPRATAPGQSTGYCSLPTVEALGEEALCLQATGTTPLRLNLSLPNRYPGELSMLVRATGTVTFLVNPGPREVFGFDTGDYNPANLSMSWLRIPISPVELTPNAALPLQVANGSVYISEIAFTPSGFYGAPTPVLPSPELTFRSEYYTPTVASLNVSTTRISPVESIIAGAIRFRNATPYYDGLGNAVFNLTSALSGDLAIQFNVTPGILLELDGIKLGGNGTTGFTQYASEFYSSPLEVPGSSFVLSFASYNDTSASIHTYNFSIKLEFVDISLQSNVTNIKPELDWSVTGNPSGYKLDGSFATLLLVRVPYFSDLTASSGATVAPALGSIDSLAWNLDNGTSITVTVMAKNSVDIGYTIFGSTLISWSILEFLWMRQRIRR